MRVQTVVEERVREITGVVVGPSPTPPPPPSARVFE
jgi:hypothetical protein